MPVALSYGIPHPGQKSATSAGITLVHIDDDFSWGETLRQAAATLAPATRIRVVTAQTRADGLKRCRKLRAAMVVMELWLQQDDGFDVLEELAALPAKPRVLALTRRCDPLAMHRAMEGRLAGLVWKTPAAPEQLGEALIALRTGGTCFPSEVRMEIARVRAAPDAYFKIISPTEQELLPWLGRGWSDEKVSRQLSREPCTIKRHRLTIQEKLGLHHEELPIWAMVMGFVPFRLPDPPCLIAE